MSEAQDPKAQLAVMLGFIGYLLEEEDSDRQLTLEGVDRMLGDILRTGSLQDLKYYVAHYTNLEPNEVDDTTESIRNYAHNVLTES